MRPYALALAVLVLVVFGGCVAPAAVTTPSPSERLSPSPGSTPATTPTSAPATQSTTPSPSAAGWTDCRTTVTEDLEPPEPIEPPAGASLAIVDTIDLPAEPAFLAYGDGNLWVSGTHGELWLLDASSGELIDEIETGSTHPSWLGFGHDSLWLVRMEEGVLLRIDPDVDDPPAEIQLRAAGDRPYTFGFDEASVWVTNQTGNTLERVDAATNSVAQVIDLRQGGPADPGPSGVALLGTRAFVSEHRSDSVARLDITSGELVRRCLGTPNPGRATATRDALWIAEIGGLLTKVDPETVEVVARLSIPGVVVSHIATRDATVWMANGSHVVAYDSVAGEAAFVELPELSDTAEFPGGQAIALGSVAAWTTDPSGHRLLRIEAQ